MSLIIKSAFAAITNPAIPLQRSTSGQDQLFAKYIAVLWKTMVIVGGIIILLYLIWGALDWIMSGSNPERLKSAKDKMFNGIFGLVILVLSYAIIQIISTITGLSILNPIWPTL